MSVTGPNRELACLALGHEDGDASECPSSDDELLAALVQEVQSLRVAAGIVEETPTDRAEQAAALGFALDDAAHDWQVGRSEVGVAVLDGLAEHGWRLVPAPRP